MSTSEEGQQVDRAMLIKELSSVAEFINGAKGKGGDSVPLGGPLVQPRLVGGGGGASTCTMRLNSLEAMSRGASRDHFGGKERQERGDVAAVAFLRCLHLKRGTAAAVS